VRIYRNPFVAMIAVTWLLSLSPGASVAAFGDLDDPEDVIAEHMAADTFVVRPVGADQAPVEVSFPVVGMTCASCSNRKDYTERRRRSKGGGAGGPVGFRVDIPRRCR